MIYLDTHLVLWLYEARLELIPKSLHPVLEENDLCISAMVLLELQYLHEIKKIRIAGQPIVDDLVARLDLKIGRIDLLVLVMQSIQEAWTRDPFDRCIVAEARLHNAALLTKDRLIHKHYELARW